MGKKVSADVIKDLEMKPTLIRVDPKSNDKCAKEENGKRYTSKTIRSWRWRLEYAAASQGMPKTSATTRN